MLSYTAGSQPLYDFKEGTCIQYTLFPFHTQVNRQTSRKVTRASGKLATEK